LPSEELGFYNEDLQYIVEPSTVKVMVGSSSEDIRLVDEYKITKEKE
jgi:beta-glucosidase